MNEILQKINAIGIVPVVKVDNASDAVPLARALIKGGLPCAEITFRTAAAEEAIRLVTEQVPEMLVGAGTVLTTEQVDRAVAAGAKFIVSPGLNPKIVQYCIDKGVPITPGTSNASDIEAAIELGLDVVKFFPAESSGGLAAIKALAGPYTSMKFMPTGGINAKNLNSYLAFPKIIACGGSWMVDPALVEAGDFEGITQLTREAMQNMLGFTLAHVGINAANGSEAGGIASAFATLLGVEHKQGNSSDFAGGLIEVMKGGGLGEHGHIAIGTNSLLRARFYLEGQGYEFDDSTLKTDEKGNPVALYFKHSLGGFAVHLLQRKV